MTSKRLNQLLDLESSYRVARRRRRRRVSSVDVVHVVLENRKLKIERAVSSSRGRGVGRFNGARLVRGEGRCGSTAVRAGPCPLKEPELHEQSGPSRRRCPMRTRDGLEM
jgi:hypothetical protein